MNETEPLTMPRAAAVAPGLRVLFGTDGSATAVKAARFVAGTLPAGAEVELLAVLSMELDPGTYLGELSDADARRARIDEATEAAVREVRAIFEAAGYRVGVRRRFGNPPDEVLAEGEAWGADLIVVGRRGLGRAAGLLLGSVSAFLLRHSAVPVLVVP